MQDGWQAVRQHCVSLIDWVFANAEHLTAEHCLAEWHRLQGPNPPVYDKDLSYVVDRVLSAVGMGIPGWEPEEFLEPGFMDKTLRGYKPLILQAATAKDARRGIDRFSRDYVRQAEKAQRQAAADKFRRETLRRIARWRRHRRRLIAWWKERTAASLAAQTRRRRRSKETGRD